MAHASPIAPVTKSVESELTTWLTVPNLLTLFRLLSTVPIVALIAAGYDTAALGLFGAASITDCLDGYIARRFNQRSALGRLLDPIADKLLTCSAFVVLSLFQHHHNAIPRWLATAVVSRDLLILAGATLVYFVTRNSGFRPTASGKINTLLEIAVIVTYLCATPFPVVDVVLSTLYLILPISIAVSALDYLIQGSRMLRRPCNFTVGLPKGSTIRR